MDNQELARVFDEIADCLEIGGGNPFRIRAYRNAARTVRELDEPASKLAAEDRLEELPGIGADLAGKIRTLLRTGSLPLHRSLVRKVPAGVRELMAVPGLGPKRAALLSRKLRVRSPEELAEAVRRGRLEGLAGFGEKSIEALGRALAGGGEERRRFLLSEAKGTAEALEALLAGTGRVALAGSWRRRRETIGDLDVLVCGEDPGAAMDRLAGWANTSRVVARGPTKMTVRLADGLQADLRAVPEASFGAALLYFTGSKAHNIELRARAQSRGLKLNEYGLFKGRKLLAGREEAEVYDALGLAWIPPELREGRGEIAAALAGTLPKLIELGDIRGDLHMHTTASDGRATLEQMAAAAGARGLSYAAITEHSKRATIAGGLGADALRRHWRAVERASRPGLVLLKGVEVDILEDGALDLPDSLLREADWVVASLHYGRKQPREQLTRRLLKAVANPHVDAIGHPTGRLIGKRPPYDADLEAVERAAAASGCALEIDGQPDRLDLDDVNAAAARRAGAPVVVDSDAHSTRELGYMEYGVFQARRAGLRAEDVLNTRTWDELRRRRRGSILQP